jgi:hypothetical protein
MELSDRDAAAMHDYLVKGGFVVFDDFRAPNDWQPFEETMRRVVPNGRFVPLDVTSPIFHAFFDIKTLDFKQAYDRGGPALFYGMYRDNDPGKPLMAIANFNNDVSQYWEWSSTDFAPIDLSNEAYKLGVNYIIYGMTH